MTKRSLTQKDWEERKTKGRSTKNESEEFEEKSWRNSKKVVHLLLSSSCVRRSNCRQLAQRRMLLYLHDKLCALGGFGLNPKVTGPDLSFLFSEVIIPRSVAAFSGLDDLESGLPFFGRRSCTSNSLSLVPTITTIIT